MAQQPLHVGGQVTGLQALEGDSFEGLGNIEELLEVAGKAKVLFPIEPAGKKEPWRRSRSRRAAREMGKGVQAQAVGPLEVIDGDGAGFAPGELHQEVGYLEVEALDGGARYRVILEQAIKAFIKPRNELVFAIVFGRDAPEQTLEERSGMIFLSAGFQVDRDVAHLRSNLELAQQPGFPHPGGSEKQRAAGAAVRFSGDACEKL